MNFQKQATLFSLLTIITLITGAFVWSTTPQASYIPFAVQIQPYKVDFNRTGYLQPYDLNGALSLSNSGLLHETGNGVAVTTRLLFDSSSICIKGMVLKKCSFSDLQTGVKLQVLGLYLGESVKVVEMKFSD